MVDEKGDSPLKMNEWGVKINKYYKVNK